MMRSLYSGVAGLRTHQTKMDVVGNNIANVNTYSYKSQRATFRDMYYQTIRSSSDGKNATQLGYGSQIGSIDTLFTQAGYAPTDRAMDVYIDGEGFITVEDPNGGEMYTRIGALSFMPVTDPATGDPTGEFKLVDINGNAVKGVNLANLGNIKTDPADPDYGKIQDADFENVVVADFADYTNISVGANGYITGIDKDGNVKKLGAIAVGKISNAEGLTMQGSSYYKAINNTGEITYSTAGTDGTGGFISGALEMSNVDLAKEFTDMITTQRGYQANSRIITVVDEMLQELVNLKR